MTEAAIGIPPAQIIPHVVNRLGLPAARRMVMTAARIGSQALSIGLADFITKDAREAEAKEAEIRKAVMRCAPNANAVSKEIIFASQTLLGKEIIDFAAKGFAEAIIGEEGRRRYCFFP